MKFLMRAIPALILMGLVLTLQVSLMHKKSEPEFTSRMVGQIPEAFSIATLHGDKPFTPDLWKGKVVVLNLFASWCAPCRAEHASVMKLAQQPGVEVLGIAWKDKPEALDAMLKENGNPYRAVGLDTNGDTTLKLGLTGVPETFIFDKSGRIAYNYKTQINDEMVEKDILPAIARLEAQDAAP